METCKWSIRGEAETMFYTTSGVPVYYEQQGQGVENALLLHGWGCDSTFFSPIAYALSAEMRVTSIDFPAHGKSGRPPEPWGVPEYAKCLVDLIKKLDIAPCNVIAHSFGCRIALYISVYHPELIKKVVITGGAGIKSIPTETDLKKQKRYQRLKKLCQQMMHVKLLGGLPAILLKRLKKKYGSKDYNSLDEEMQKTFIKVISLDMREKLKLISIPTLLVWGENDTETPIWMGQLMASEIPDAALITFERGTHFAYLEQWQRFVPIVLHFFIKG